MATVSKYYKKSITDGLTAKTLKCCLLKNTHTMSASSHYYSDISANECTGTGYTAGGILLTTLSSSQVGDNASFTAASAVFTGVTVIAHYACIYDSVSGAIIQQVDFNGDKTCDGGQLTVTWSANGILTVS
jgi:hypothetical protein